ncbi:unnamed protein product [Amaranthus hypochondriacus]
MASISTAMITPKNMLTTPKTSKPGCPRNCGNLTIPYPFGISTKCSLHDWFSIKCNTSYNPPKAFFDSGIGSEDPEILDITQTHIVIRNFKNQVAFKCYAHNGTRTTAYVGIFDMKGFPFSYSSSANELIVIGCDDFAEIHAEGFLPNGNQFNYTTGCLAMCSTTSTINEKLLQKGSCSGTLCCHTAIPIGTQTFKIILSPLVRSLYYTQHCGYAFIAGNQSFRYTDLSNLSINTSTTVGVNRVVARAPVVLDWSVGVSKSSQSRLNCSKAMKNMTAYVCQKNSECVESEAGGYYCKCRNGFEGNPYLKPGCTDVNECRAGKNNPCSMGCVNTVGSFKCPCPKGYSGDGLKSGTGCVKNSDNNSSANLRRITLGLGISLGIILVLFVSWWFSTIIKKRRIIKQKAKNFARNGGLIRQIDTDESVVARMKFFTSDELERATDNFNENRILGQGGQGIVYKGMLGEGKIVAIKKSIVISETHLEGLINELVLLSQINHRNIVKLLGCCLETEVPLLVYEFVPNGNLHHLIHNPSEEFPITWRMRLQIASDSAAALVYLHSSSSIPILHRDIKSSNILLDDKYRAKVSDFGTSRSFAIDQTHVTTRVMGTFGYLDPQYFQSSVYTEKSDVYSFGVLLVELLTGQKALIKVPEDEDKNLTACFLKHMENSRLIDILDSQIIEEGSNDEFYTIAKLAMRCLNLDGKKRPTMKEVLLEIEGVLSLHIQDKNPKILQRTQKLVTQTTNYDLYDSGCTSSTQTNSDYTNSKSSVEVALLFNPR